MKWLGIGIGVGLTAIACAYAVANGGPGTIFIAVPVTAFWLGLFAACDL